ncbi:MAG: hypothetical protein IJQ07_05825 [Clostridia bacterium]|nr:hypothetical protein [Clostridia bacterium]
MEKTFEVGIWSSAKPTLNDYKILKDCGMTHAFIDENYSKRGTKEYTELLKYCEQVGLKAYLFNYNSTQAFLNDKTDYSVFPAFDGIIIWDEPSAKCFDEIASVIPEFEKRFPNKTFIVNLLPNYGVLYDEKSDKKEYLGESAYERYISQFCEKILSKIHGRRILSVDYYVLDIIPEENKVFLQDSFLKNLEIMAKYAKMYNAEPFLYVQSTSFGKWRREPLLADFYFQYYVAFAYGVRGINHFTYTTPPTGGEFADKDIALIDRNNIPTDKYYFVQKVNADFKKISEILFAYDYVGTFVKTGENIPEQHEYADINSLSYSLRNLQKIKNVASQESVVIGEFSKGGKFCYLIVNYSDPYRKLSNNVRIPFITKTAFSVLKNNVLFDYVGDEFTAELKEGEGVLLIV